MAEGSRRRLIYVAESTWGETPVTPACKVLRGNGGNGIRLGRDTLQSQEMRSDRQVADVRMGNKKPSLDVPFEFSFGSFDDFLAAALFGTWTTAYTLTNQTVTVVAGTKVFSRAAGSWITDGVKIGDKITTTGFEDAGNNGTFLVSNVTALEITCATASGLVNVSGDTGVGVTTSRQVLKQGVTPKFFTIEEGFTDIGKYQVMTGAMVNALSLTVANNAMVTGSFGLIAKAASAFSGTSIDSTPDAAPTTSPFDSYTGYLKEGGSVIAIVTGLSLNLANGLEPLFALFNPDTYRIGVGRANLTGSVSAYFEDEVMANKFVNETESSLEFELEDLAGNVYRFTVPRIKYTGSDKSMTENNVSIDMPFQGLADSTLGTCLQIEKLPA